MSYWQYGAYVHPAGEVKLSSHQVVTEFSPRGERTGFRHRFQLQGDVIASTQADFITRINAIEAAYANDYNDFGLYFDDGTPTPHGIVSQNTASGTHVEYFAWHDQDRAELATHRSFSVSITAFVEDHTSQIMGYFENIEFHGSGARRWEWVRTPAGTIGKQQDIHNYTPQIIIQWGQIVARTIYPTGNVPPPVFPAWEHENQRIVRALGPQWIGNAHRNFGIAWRYVMEAPDAQSATPTLLFS